MYVLADIEIYTSGNCKTVVFNRKNIYFMLTGVELKERRMKLGSLIKTSPSYAIAWILRGLAFFVS